MSNHICGRVRLTTVYHSLYLPEGASVVCTLLPLRMKTTHDTILVLTVASYKRGGEGAHSYLSMSHG